MTAITRQSAKIFAQNAPVGQVTAFRTTESTPQTTKAPDQIQNENYLQGWLNADGSGNVLPYAEDMNGLFYTLSYNTAYLYEKGIPEYSSTQTYYLNSFCQYSGTIYRCKGDSVINIAPTNTNYWDALPSSSYTATTVGAATSNYGTVYAGTNTAGTQFQFKTIIGGSNVTITEANDSLTISSTGGGGGTAITASAPLDLTNNVLSIPAATSSQGGYLTAADWTSFNSKLSSTIFSSNNTWTGTNNFNDVLPNSNNTSTLGSETNAWLEVYANYLIGTTSDHITIANTTDNNRLLINYLSSGAQWGIFPDTEAGTDSYLGTSLYKWTNAYISSVNTDDLIPISSSVAISGNFIPKATTSYSLGNTSARWSYVYANNIIFADSAGGSTNHNFIGYLANTNSYRMRWYSAQSSSGDSQELYFDGNTIRAGLNSEVSLGDPTHYFYNVYGSKYYLTSNVNLSSVASGNAMRLTWYDADNSKFRGLDLVGASFRPRNDTEISLGDQYGRWKDLYLTAGSSGGIYFGADTSHTYIRDVTSNTLVLNATGSVQIHHRGTQRYQFSNTNFVPVGGSSNSIDLGANGTGFRWNTVYYTTLNPTSDIRLKDNIVPLESGLKIVNDLDIKSFTYKNSPDHIEYGIIAQEVVEKYPELISVPDSDDGTYGTYLHNFIFVSLRAIQELSAEVEILKQQLKELKK